MRQGESASSWEQGFKTYTGFVRLVTSSYFEISPTIIN